MVFQNGSSFRRNEWQAIRGQFEGTPRKHEGAQEIERWPVDFVRDAGIPDDAKIEASVVGYERVTVGERQQAWEHLVPARAIPHGLC